MPLARVIMIWPSKIWSNIWPWPPRQKIGPKLKRICKRCGNWPTRPSIYPILEIPPNQAAFVLINYTDQNWNVDIGPYFLEARGRTPEEAYSVSWVIINPGSYTWKAISADGQSIVTTTNRDTGFDFSVGAGEMTVQSVGGRIE